MDEGLLLFVATPAPRAAMRPSLFFLKETSIPVMRILSVGMQKVSLVFPIPSSFPWIILLTDRPFLSLVFPQLRFSDASLWDVDLLLDPPFSSPLAGASDSVLKATLPGDFSGIAIEPLADSTHRATEAPDEVATPAVPVLPSSCSDDSYVPLADITKVVVPAVTAVTREGKGSPPSSDDCFSSIFIVPAPGWVIGRR